jgi:hypothetical protein
MTDYKSTDYKSMILEDARLIILRELSSQTDGSLNSSILLAVLDAFGHRRTPEFLLTQLHFLADVGAVMLKTMGSVTIASITQAGLDHVERRRIIAGVKRPSIGV